MFSLNPPRVRIGLRELSLDHPGDYAFVSHAHSDNAVGLKAKKLVASEATLDLMRARNYAVHGTLEKEPYGVKWLSAGHVLGAKQLVAETEEGVFAYTGDFNTRDSVCVSKAEIPSCDVLYMEATFGSPEFVFPDPEVVAQEIASWAKEEQKKGIVVLGGYALGKAQELVKILNDYAGITPLVEDQIGRVNDVYVNHGVKLDFIRASSEEGLKELEKNFVAVVPMNKVNNNFAFHLSRAYSKRVSTAIATGWALTERFSSKSFCLSDHADFPGLIDFVEQTGAKKIFVNYGNAKRFARELRAKGLNAQALEEQQKMLVAWD